MKYYVELGDQTREVELTDRHGQLEVRLDGEPVEVEYDEVDRLGQIALKIGERTFAVSIDGSGNEFGVTVAGRFFGVRIEDERERAAHAAERARSKGGGVVTSVMPGIVVEILVEEGQAVEEGQPLLILEAMKMQNEIRAEGQGTVKAVPVSAGDSVAAGALLVQF